MMGHEMITKHNVYLWDYDNDRDNIALAPPSTQNNNIIKALAKPTTD